MSFTTKEYQKNTLLQLHEQKAENLGFWDEIYFSVLLKGIERMFTRDVIREYYVADLILRGNKTLIKWEKRFHPLTEDELQQIYENG